MALLPAVKQGLRLAGKIDRKYNLNKIFIQKYVPPHQRKFANKLVDIAGTLGGGYGIVRFIESLYSPDTPGNGGSIPFQKQRFTTRKSYKTRGRQSVRYGARCRPNDKYGSSRRRPRYQFS